MSRELKYATISVHPKTHKKLRKAKLVRSGEDNKNYSWSEFLEYLLELHEKQGKEEK